MREPFRTEFLRLLESGAGRQDIHDASTGSGFAAPNSAWTVSDRTWLDREVVRHESHRRHLCPILEAALGGAGEILDVGCSTGGTTVALALSERLGARTVVGVDPNTAALEAARIRSRALEVEARVRFAAIMPGRLPFADASFDLVTCVSVLEFITREIDRWALVAELQRVTRPGGHVFVSTPSPFRLVELHTRRVLGDWVRRDGHPWALPPGRIRAMFEGWELVPITRHVLAERPGLLRRVGPLLPPAVDGAVASGLRWQKVLARRPVGTTA